MPRHATPHLPVVFSHTNSFPAGTYRLLFNDRRGWYEIGTGETAEECLSVWKGRLPRTTRTPAEQDAAR